MILIDKYPAIGYNGRCSQGINADLPCNSKSTPQGGKVEATQTNKTAERVQTGVSVTIQRPPEAVFAALTDVAGYTSWARGPEEVTDISEDPVRLGTTWQQTGRFLGKKLVTRLQVNTYEVNQKFGYGADKPLPMDILFSLAPVPGGTELQMVVSSQPGGFFGKIAMPIMAKSLERQMESDLYTLKGILENGA
jgi:uncharacterized protein YndB with AHSA1/START domain